jgi:hypothetical protein
MPVRIVLKYLTTKLIKMQLYAEKLTAGRWGVIMRDYSNMVTL